MTIENKALVLDLLEWVASKPRTYAEVMDAWRTSCPRLPIWEDTRDHGFVRAERANGSGSTVTLTPTGREFLARERPDAAPAAARSPSPPRA
jgi:DNA-binding PadR family transcriptional regulator